MNILFATSECAPFIKTGGLADVAGALPKALAGNGHDVRVILPLYEGIGEEWRSQMTYLQCFHITLAWRSPYCGIFELKRDGVTYWFVDNEYYFKRSNIYGHYDDGERFAYFSRAVVESMGWLNWHPDVLHCNDWQTALVPIYLLEERHRIPQLCDTKSVFTIHNIEYQADTQPDFEGCVRAQRRVLQRAHAGLPRRRESDERGYLCRRLRDHRLPHLRRRAPVLLLCPRPGGGYRRQPPQAARHPQRHRHRGV